MFLLSFDQETSILYVKLLLGAFYLSYTHSHSHTLPPLHTHMQHLTSRFWPLNDVETDAILHLNEEVNLTVDEVSASMICGSLA